MDIKLRFYNTLTREVEDFVPIEKGRVRMYTCGPTVYDYAHIGNLKSYIFEDVLRRTLQYFGYEVVHVQNITDVGHLRGDGNMGEDKIEAGAKKLGKTAWEIAEFYTDEYKVDLELLNILPPTHWPRATEYIAEQIEFIQEIEKMGFTYNTDDGVYFDT